MIESFRSLFAPPRHFILIIAAMWIGLTLAEKRTERHVPCKTFTDRELRADLAAAGLRVASVRGVNILHCLLPASVLMGLPREVGAGWRAVSSMLQGLDGMVARLPWFYRLASTRLVVAVKD